LKHFASVASGFARLHCGCSRTASLLQSHCKPVAVTLQRSCSNTANGVAATLQNVCSVFAASFHWHTDVCERHSEEGLFVMLSLSKHLFPFLSSREKRPFGKLRVTREGKIADTLSLKYLQGVSAILQSFHSQRNKCEILADGR